MTTYIGGCIHVLPFSYQWVHNRHVALQWRQIQSLICCSSSEHNRKVALIRGSFQCTVLYDVNILRWAPSPTLWWTISDSSIGLKWVESDIMLDRQIKLFTDIRQSNLLISMSMSIFMLMRDKLKHEHEQTWKRTQTQTWKWTIIWSWV